MGNTCNGKSTPQHYEVNKLVNIYQGEQFATTKRAVNIMYEKNHSQVQKLKMDGDNMYKLILTVQGERQQSRTMQMKFMFSYADMEIAPQYKFTLQDMTHFPIIDTLQQSMINNPQVYHKIRTLEKKKKLMKYYNFNNLNDYHFKNGLYQISLYQRLKQHSMLQDYFVIYKGEVKQLVMIFNYSYVTLHDMLYYRKLASYQWEEMELLIIMHMLCESLIELKRINIVHRDIRPGKVFFTPLTNVSNSTELIMSGYSEGSNGRFYNLMNLQSARVYERGYGVLQGESIMKDYRDDTDLLTVKGVPTFTDSPVRQSLQREQHKANYNPYHSDIHSLKHTLKSLITLQPNNTLSLDENKLKSQPKIYQLFKYICSTNITIQQLNDKILQLMGILTFNKPTFYFTMVRDFYMKELTIAQNIQMNLYFNSGVGGSNNTTQRLIRTNSIEQVNNPSNNSVISGKQFAQDLYIRALYDLHKKDIFVPLMLQKLTKNFELNKKQQNVSLLVKVGKYFEQAGIKQNQYYKQAIMLLLQLAQEERLEGFYKDHQRLIALTQEMFNKFDSDSKMIIRAKCTLLKEKAYRELFSSSTTTTNQSPQMLLSIMLNSSNIRQSSNNNNLIVQNLINQAYQLAMRSNLSFEEQLELIYSKGELELLMGKVEEGEMMYLRGYQLTERNYKEFMTVHNCTKYKAIFQYGLGMVDLIRLKSKAVQKSPKLLFSLQTKLTTAKQRLSTITIHSIYIIRCYIALGDLLLLKQSPQQALNSYQKGLNLLQAENSQSEERKISSQIQLSIVERIVDIGNGNVNGVRDVQRYEVLYESLKREVNKERKSQKKYSRKGKLTTGSVKSTTTNSNRPQQLYQDQLPLLPVIKQQQQQQIKFIESQNKFNQNNNKLDSRPSFTYDQPINQHRESIMKYNSKQRQSPINISLGYEYQQQQQQQNHQLTQ